MAVTTVVQYASLSHPVVLAPERYDPRRIQVLEGDGIALSELVSIQNPTIPTSSFCEGKKYLVLDTSDSFEGVIRPRCEPVDGSTIRSAKKLVRSGDVIISRLRPYLRQVAYVDNELENIAASILVSTEYFVLRSRNPDESTAWLVPFLLNSKIQAVLGRAQEGGHHPRFTRQTLGELLVPRDFLVTKSAVSETVEEHIGAIRRAYLGMQQLVDTELS